MGYTFRRIVEAKLSPLCMKLNWDFCKNQTSLHDCNATQVWNSQPFIANVPAGNILLSASILFTGALPTKALRVFRHLNCATISPKTFFYISESLLTTLHIMYV